MRTGYGCTGTPFCLCAACERKRIPCLSHRLWARRWREPPTICDGRCEALDWDSDVREIPYASDVERSLAAAGFRNSLIKSVLIVLRDGEFVA